jgi:organic radical activating enzyme
MNKPLTQDVLPRDLYRLPWTLTDNVLSWLEPTKRCNLYCEGCYSRNEAGSDKSLAEVRSDLETFVRLRNVDSISIAGGDPLVHPQIVDIVRMIRQDFKLKAVINTNGLALSDTLLDQLAGADVSGFTFHIDSGQVRPGWKRKNEIELCELRLRLARMVAARGDISVAFNATIYPHTKHYVPDLVDWAAEHISIVHSMVFILFRTTREDKFDYCAGDKLIKLDELVYHDATKNPEPVVAQEVLRLIRERDPNFAPSAYLGGTSDPQSFKWVIGTRLGTKDGIYGHLGPRAMEALQVGHHALTGRYLGYSKPSLLRQGKATALALSAIDESCRQALRSYARDTAASPKKLMQPLHMQSILVIQPIDNLEDGRENMCDGCPDMTVHEGKLVWSCRLDEIKQYGTFLTAVPKDRKRLLQLGPRGTPSVALPSREGDVLRETVGGPPIALAATSPPSGRE